MRLDSYSRALVELNDDANAFEFIEWYGNQPRGEFESIIPAKADFISFVQRHAKRKEWAAIRAEREAREEAEAREIQEDVERRKREGGPKDPVGDMIAAAAPKRSVLTGWTAAELRAAADALDAGKTVAVPDPKYLTWEERQARRREWMKANGITAEMMEQEKRRVLGIKDNPVPNNPGYQLDEAGSVEERRG